MKSSCWESLLGLIAISVCLSVGCQMCGTFLEKRYKGGIDRNGLVLKAVVSNIYTSKEVGIRFYYRFKGVKYSNFQGSACLITLVNIGDTIVVKANTKKPDDSYVLSPTCH